MAAHPSKRMLTIFECLYSMLLYVYPGSFRRTYGREMVLTFRDCGREALQQRGGWGLVWWWIFILSDLLMTAFFEHVNT